MAKGVVLGLGGGEVGWVVESEFLPFGCEMGLIPACGAGGTDEDTHERGDHGVSVEEGGGERVFCRHRF